MYSQRPKKVALAGLTCEESQGDILLIECAKFLIKKRAPFDVEFVEVDFFGTDLFKKSKGVAAKSQNNETFTKRIKDNCIRNVLNSNCNYLKNRIYKKQYKEFFNSVGTTVFMKKYFDDKLKDVDLIVFFGGGTIKYDVRVDFSRYYRRILNAAKEKKIPIVVLSAGIESVFNKKDARCQLFSETLSDNLFKYISTRDNIEELSKYVTNKQTGLSKIADIGVWSADVYNVVKNKDADTVGIGVIVADRFVEFHTGITPKMYDDVLVGVINRLLAKGEKVEIFNNGDSKDEAYAKHIAALAGINQDLVKTAKTPEDIVKTISNYKGIISSRLHSVIPAYSLDVPFIAISWNNKLKYFAENIGVKERVIEKEQMDCDNITKAFEKALVEGYDNSFKEKYKQTDLEFIDKCIGLIE